MNIVFLATSRIPSERAMATAIMKQCEGFSKEGHTVTLVIPHRRNKLVDDPFEYHKTKPIYEIRRLFCIELPFMERLSYPLRQITFIISVSLFLLRKSKETILYSREPELLGMIPSRKQKFVEIHHFYGLSHFGRFFLKQMRGIISITSHLKEDLIHRYACEKEKILVAPSGVSLKDFEAPEGKEKARERLGLPQNIPIALYAGEFDTWKGVDVFLEASKELKQRGVLSVVIGGRDKEVDAYKNKYPQVIFLGRRSQSELPHNQQVADVLVIPNSSKFEISMRHTSPLKAFTAMASGVPIVAADIPSIREVLREDTAFFFIPDKASELCAKVLFVLKHTDEGKIRSTNAKTQVKAFDWSARSKNIIAFIYESQTKTHS